MTDRTTRRETCSRDETRPRGRERETKGDLNTRDVTKWGRRHKDTHINRDTQRWTQTKTQAEPNNKELVISKLRE